MEIENLCNRLFEPDSGPLVLQTPAEKSAVSETSLETELESFIDSSADETNETPSSVKLELEVFRLNGQKGTVRYRYTDTELLA